MSEKFSFGNPKEKNVSYSTDSISISTGSSQYQTFTPKDDLKTSKKDKRKKIVIGATIVGIILLVAYFVGVKYYQTHFLPNTFVSGVNVSNQDLTEAKEKITTMTADRRVKIVGRDGQMSQVKATDVGLTQGDTTSIDKAIQEQNAYSWPLDILPFEKTFLDGGNTLNEDALNQIVAGLPIVTGNHVYATENARADYDGNSYHIREEVYGNEIDVPKLTETVKESLLTGDNVIDLSKVNCYVQPTLKKDNATLQSSVNQLNQVLNSTVTYDFETEQVPLDKTTFATWFGTDANGNIVFDENQAAAFVQGLKDRYDTVDKQVDFTTSAGEPIKVTNYYNLWEINKAQEVSDLKQNLMSGQQVTKQPAYSSTGSSRSQANAVTGNYVEISIGGQHMWFYKDGQLVVDTPVVTGNPYSGHATARGLFCIQYKDTNVTLKGPGYASPVTFWMPFNGGQGIHDSSWRGSYGGSIYLGGGSHGCVNTPYSAVKTIFNNIEVGTPVVVY